MTLLPCLAMNAWRWLLRTFNFAFPVSVLPHLSAVWNSDIWCLLQLEEFSELVSACACACVSVLMSKCVCVSEYVNVGVHWWVSKSRCACVHVCDSLCVMLKEWKKCSGETTVTQIIWHFYETIESSSGKKKLSGKIFDDQISTEHFRKLKNLFRKFWTIFECWTWDHLGTMCAAGTLDYMVMGSQPLYYFITL